MREKSRSKGGCCGWFIAFVILALVVGAIVYAVKKKIDNSNSDKPEPVPGPPGAIDQKYASALKTAMQFFDVQKSGKLENNKISWRGDSALKDGKQADLDLTKGMYDAGDHMKFGFPMAFTASVLSWAILEYGDQMDAVGQLEPAQDSLRWITDFLVNAHPSENVLYIQVGDPVADHKCWNRPELITEERPLLQVNVSCPGSDVAAETAAAMASASLVFKKSDATYSSTLLKHAKQLFTFADKHRGIYSENIPEVATYYNSTGYGDELLWAATWLYHATGDDSYLQYVTGQNGEDYAQFGSPTWFSWDNKLAGTQVLLSRVSFFKAKGLSSSYGSGLQNYRKSAEAVMCGLLPDSPTATKSRTDNGLIWVSEWNALQHPVASAFLASVYSDYMLTTQTPNIKCDSDSFKPSDLRDFARSQADYVLGKNPQHMSFLVGYGKNFPQFVHHRGASIPANAKTGCKDGWQWLDSSDPNPNVATGALVGQRGSVRRERERSIMSMSDSDSSSYGGANYQNFKQITRDRLLHEMLRSTKTGDSKSTWKVLIMDKLTIKIMSNSCKMADITDEGVSLVEDIHKRRQPLPTMDAIYFIQPTRENIIMFLSDMAGRAPLYRKAFVFLSSPISRELVLDIRKGLRVSSRLGALREMNLEYFAIDCQGFITNNERALEDLFGNEENNRKGVACLNAMATRIATVFASLREFPSIRFRAAKSLDANTMTTFRDLVPTKLAAGVWDCLTKYKKTIPNFPQTETCELLIIDRTIDQIAPVIHEWTYDAMCHDLLNMEGNKYVHEVPGKAGGLPERKEVLLEDHDPVWLELRHAHIADASERLHAKMTSFISKNKAAQIQHGSRSSSEMSTRDLQKMVQALPQYSEQIDKLSLHVELAGKINSIIRESGLRELGQVEQDLVFGDATMKDVIKFLTMKEDTTHENKLRLLMILAAVYPEKFDGEKGQNLMKVARLTDEDMTIVNNLRMLGGQPDTKKRLTGAFGLKFDIQKVKVISSKKKRAARIERPGEEEKWQLSRFYPIIEELIEKLTRNQLSKEDYPCLNDPSATFHSSPFAGTLHQNPHSMRSRRTPSWAKPRGSDDGYSSDSVLRHASSDFKKMGQRLFVFIVGGATRSELRACHKLTRRLNREIILGSSSLDDPAQFITKLKMLTTHELTLDDIQI